MTALPIEPILPDLLRALREDGRAVLQAPPGAGKTTMVPPALLNESWLEGRKIVMLEPRRLAARAAARRMAQLRGEEVGETFGYRVRLDSRVGPATRVEVATEGILVRQLQQDPGLEGVGCVILDEFHERSLDADLALALLLETRAALRDDLRLLVMSATLDAAPVARLMDDAPVLTSEGRAFPVATRWLDRAPLDRLAEATASAVRRALEEETGSLLVFLPGQAEIRRVEALLDGRVGPDVLVAPLYGDLAPGAQDAAIRPAPEGRRKIVLATSIAETSLTIEGVRVVVDAGYARVPRFDPARGMTRLETVKVSQAAAEQRRGRAGRLGPGVCYRLWSEAEHRGLVPFDRPEILEADLAPLALELAQWGADPADLAWLDPPPAAALGQAQDLLRRLGALDADGRVTPHGRAMARLGVHPRLAHMAVEGARRGLGGLACDLAAILGERDLIRGREARDADLTTRLDALRGASVPGADRGAVMQAREAARRLRRQIRAAGGDEERGSVGALVALAYPDRIAQRRGGAAGSFRLSSGRGASLPETEPLAAQDFLAVADLDAGRADARIFRAAPLTLTEIEDEFADAIESVDAVEWDLRSETVAARRQRRLWALVLEDKPLPNPPAEASVAAMLQGVRQMGLHVLPWDDATRSWRDRVAFLRRVFGAEWPDVSDAALLANLESWLAPFLNGVMRRAQLAKIDLKAALGSLLDWKQSQELDRLAPARLEVPSGSRVALDYSGEVPVLAARLQEMFGATETPTVAGGRVPALLHLLSPARRPVQVTQDLISFWDRTYAEVKRDLKGQYPKHYWPDDPRQAEATARIRPRPR